MKRGHESVISAPRATDKSEHLERRWLRLRRERPGDGGAADQCDEIATGFFLFFTRSPHRRGQSSVRWECRGARAS